VPTTLTRDCLRLDRNLSDAEYSRYRELIDQRRGFGYYQKLEIRDAAGKQLTTPGSHPCQAVITILDAHGFPRDFAGKSVLDIGCNAGFYSFVARLRGARSVLGIDQNQHYIDQANLMKEIVGIDVDFRTGDGHSLDGGIGAFDIVINTGVIYHLQNPIDFLCQMAKLTREFMYLETEALLSPHLTDYAWFIEGSYCEDHSNWWVYGPRCVERMVRAAGFARAEFQGFVWTPPPGTKTPEGYDRQGRAAFTCWK